MPAQKKNQNARMWPLGTELAKIYLEVPKQYKNQLIAIAQYDRDHNIAKNNKIATAFCRIVEEACQSRGIEIHKGED